MIRKSQHIFSILVLACSSLAAAGTAQASPFDTLMDGFSMGMTKEQAMARIQSGGGDTSSIRCSTMKSQHRVSDTCWLMPAYKPGSFYGFTTNEMTLSFRENKLDAVGIKLDWGDPEAKNSYRTHSAFSQRVLQKIRSGMDSSIKEHEKLAGTKLWKKDGLTFDYSARHMKDDLFPAPYASQVSIEVYTDGYLASLREPAKEEKKGWLSSLRQLVN